MLNKPVITSPLDNDLYKFTMMQAVFHQFPTTIVKYKFKCRSQITLSKEKKQKIIEKLEVEIEHLKALRFGITDIQKLREIGFFKEDYLNYMLGRSVIMPKGTIQISESESSLFEMSYEGTWLDRILMEVPLLAVISEIGIEVINEPNSNENFDTVLDSAIQKRIDFAKKNSAFRFADFGTRRRFSKAYHEKIIAAFKKASDNNETNALVGTSNVWLAGKYNLVAIGTHAHEWFQAMQAKTNLRNFQKFGLQAWADEYRGSLGVALSDCVGMKQFLKDFDLYFSKLFDGCRHDSGDPYVWMNSLLAHYEKMNIDAKTKSAIFSDGLIPITIKYNVLSTCTITQHQL